MEKPSNNDQSEAIKELIPEITPIPGISEEIKDNKEDEKYKVECLGDEGTEYDISYKFIIIGNSAVGKSCLSLKLTRDVFEENFISTIGFEFFTFYLKINGEIIKIQIWDTCGQEAYRSLISNFYRNSSAAIIVKDSFNDVEIWYKQLKNHCSPDCKIFLIGNKSDLEDQRKVSYGEGLNCKEKYKFDSFFETSAKTGVNVKELFIDACLKIYKETSAMRSLKKEVDNDPEALRKLNKSLAKIDNAENEGGCC